MHQEFSLMELKEYFRSQKDICFKSELYNDKYVHGSKIIMLFAEVFSFIVKIYGVNNSSKIITQYSNTTGFKKWFWKIKHRLGEYILSDPTFCDIGKWIGKGFFLKICISLIIFNGLLLEENILNKMINKQKKLLKELSEEKYFANGKKAIITNNDHYILLNEKISLSYTNEHFFIENLII